MNTYEKYLQESKIVDINKIRGQKREDLSKKTAIVSKNVSKMITAMSFVVQDLRDKDIKEAQDKFEKIMDALRQIEDQINKLQGPE